jgi:hypothetical protein
MRTIAPKIDAPVITIAEEQEEYKTVVAAQAKHPLYGCMLGRNHNSLVLAFRPTDAERRRLAAGEDIYVHLLTFGGPMTPIIVNVGAEEAAACYGLKVTE